MCQNISASVDGGPSGGSRVRGPPSALVEIVYQSRQQTLVDIDVETNYNYVGNIMYNRPEIS